MRFIVVAAWVVAAGAAQAQTALPDFDPRAFCQGLYASGANRSESLLGGCLRNEQRAYNQLKEEWPKLPEHIRATCAQAHRDGGNYSIMAGCMRNELRARQHNQDFQFRR